MIFVDASAIIAILTAEPEGAALADVLRSTEQAITSPIAVYEAALGVRRKRISSVETAQDDIAEFLTLARVRVVGLPADCASEALAAFGRFGKGQGHPAQLNMADCFAYAVARRHGAAMLFVGADFAATDITPALPAR